MNIHALLMEYKWAEHSREQLNNMYQASTSRSFRKIVINLQKGHV